MSNNTKIYTLDATPRNYEHIVGQRQLYKVDLQDGLPITYTTLERHDWVFPHRTVSYYVKVSTGEVVKAEYVDGTPFLELIDCTSPSRQRGYLAA